MARGLKGKTNMAESEAWSGVDEGRAVDHRAWCLTSAPPQVLTVSVRPNMGTVQQGVMDPSGVQGVLRCTRNGITMMTVLSKVSCAAQSMRNSRFPVCPRCLALYKEYRNQSFCAV